VTDWQKQYAHLESDLRELVTAMSHDLRAPVRAVDGFSRALAGACGAELDPSARHYLEQVRDSSYRTGQLVEGLVGMARLSLAPLRVQAVDLSALGRQVLAELQAAEPSRVVEAQVAPGLWVQGDAQLLPVLLQSLLSNAWKFTRAAQPAHIRLDRRLEEGRTVFEVVDSGVGFDMNRCERLFEPFCRLHPTREYPGLGLGLARARRVVRRHGGEIWARGAPGSGATFSFTITTEGP
jgi:light-regulated signal transduction histidine kinase (bacteriophytochrome)